METIDQKEQQVPEKVEIKNKKPFYKKWYGVVAIIIVVSVCLGLILTSSKTYKKDEDIMFNRDAELAGLRYKIPKGWESEKKGVLGQTKSKFNKLYEKKENGESKSEFQLAFIGYGNWVTSEQMADLLKVSKKSVDKDSEENVLSKALLSLSFSKTWDDDWKTKAILFYKDNATFYATFSAFNSDVCENASKKIMEEVDISAFKSNLKPKSMIAKYLGGKKEGTEINDKSNILVNAKLKDGEKIKLINWEIKKSKVLSAGKTTVVEISYNGIKTNLKVECSTLSKEQFINRCKEYSYNRLAHESTGDLMGKKIKIIGEVFQVLGDGEYLVTINDSFDKVHVVTDGSESKIIKGDKIVVYGIVNGDYEYTTVMGANETIPEVKAKYLK